MKPVDFENANKLDWADRRIEWTALARLLLFTYETRPEAIEFRDRNQELKDICLESESTFVYQISDIGQIIT